MQFITSLFGGSENTLVTAAFALGIVLVLIVLGVWLLKLVFRVSSNGVRGRNKRLGIVDSLVLDQKRQLLIVRRDGVEHLLLVGGPQDLVVESGIAAPEMPAAQPPRRPAPMVNRRKAPLPTEPRPEPKVPTPAPTPPLVVGPGAAIDRAREANRVKEQVAPRSLRHTGLLRPTGSQENAPTVHRQDISSAPHADSVNEEANLASEGTTRDNDKQGEANRI